MPSGVYVADLPVRTCRCGATFKPKRAYQRYCSTECRRAKAQEERPRLGPLPERNCDLCGAPFQPRAANQRYCSAHQEEGRRERDRARTDPQRARNQRRARERAKRQAARAEAAADALANTFRVVPLQLPRTTNPACIRCGLVLDRTKHKWQRMHPECRAAAQREWMQDGRRNGKHRRRARSRGGEHIKLANIAVRDNWTCHLCGEAVTQADWSLDHVVPLAHGGTHTHDNVRLAHHRCNTLKADHNVVAITYL